MLLDFHSSASTPPLPLPPPGWGLDDPIPDGLTWPEGGRESTLRRLRLVLKALRPRPKPLAQIEIEGPEIEIETMPDPWPENLADESEAA